MDLDQLPEKLQTLVQSLNGLTREDLEEAGVALDDDQDVRVGFSKFLHEWKPQVWQRIADFGISKFKEDTHNPTVTAMEEKIERLEGEKENLQEQIDELESEQPDIEKLKEQHKEEKESLKEQHQEEKERLTGQIRDIRLDNAEAQLRSTLVEEHGLNKRMARSEARWIRQQRLDLDDDDQVVLRQEDSEDAVIPSDGKSPIDMAAGEVVEEIDDPNLFDSGVNRGGGSQGSGGGSGSPSWVEQAKKKGQEDRKEMEAESAESRKEKIFGPATQDGGDN